MLANKTPNTNEDKNNSLIILKLLSPCTFRVSNSFLDINSKKKNWVDIKNIKGKISNKLDGAFNNETKKGKKILVDEFLKKFTSSKIFKIIIKDKNTTETINIFLYKILIKKVS